MRRYEGSRWETLCGMDGWTYMKGRDPLIWYIWVNVALVFHNCSVKFSPLQAYSSWHVFSHSHHQPHLLHIWSGFWRDSNWHDGMWVCVTCMNTCTGLKAKHVKWTNWIVKYLMDTRMLVQLPEITDTHSYTYMGGLSSKRSRESDCMRGGWKTDRQFGRTKLP